MTGTLAAALAYAARGWPVFPCKPGSKAPNTEHGFLDATTDPAVIRAWWQRWPAANVAIATGTPGPDVLDVDNHDTGSGFAAFNRLKRAGLLTGAGSLVGTRSGGLHAYYAGTGQACGRLPAHHLDFKAAGGYVIAPPSRVLGRPYELLGHRPATARLDWQALRRLLEPPGRSPARPSRGGRRGGNLAAWVAGQREGNRNGALFWAACRAAETGDAAALEHISAAAVSAGLTEAEVRRTVASAARRAGA
jgi:Bifunctional DNA primase/polymerase, N-terminal/Primase C terminal 1 (PriCT-1)